MAENDATPQVAAVVPDTTQPAPQAVEVPAVATPSTTEAQASPAEQAVTAPATQDSTQQELDTIRKRYADSSAEALRLYRENESLKRQSQPARSEPPPEKTYTPIELEQMKIQIINLHGKAMVEGDQDKANEYAGNLVWVDQQLRKSEITQFTSRQTSQAAYQKLAAEVQPILTQYKDDLAPGTPIYNQAQQLYQDAVTAGAAANDVTATSAVLLALAKSGKFQQNTTLKAAVQTANSMNQAIKSAAVAGGGGANTGRSATPDIASMNAQQFEEYRHSLGVTKRQR